MLLLCPSRASEVVHPSGSLTFVIKVNEVIPMVMHFVLNWKHIFLNCTRHPPWRKRTT